MNLCKIPTGLKVYCRSYLYIWWSAIPDNETPISLSFDISTDDRKLISASIALHYRVFFCILYFLYIKLEQPIAALLGNEWMKKYVYKRKPSSHNASRINLHGSICPTVSPPSRATEKLRNYQAIGCGARRQSTMFRTWSIVMLRLRMGRTLC